MDLTVIMKQSMFVPDSIDIERVILGSCILSDVALSRVIEKLKPSDFTDPGYKQVYEVLLNMYNLNRPIDLLTVSEALKVKGIFDRLGGQAFIVSIANSVTTSSNATYYADLLREYSVRRKLVDAADTIARLAGDFSKTIPEILEDAEKILFDAGQNKSSSDFIHVREIIGPVFIKLEAIMKSNGVQTSGYITSYTDVDNFTGGLQPGSLTVIAARPSMGKTALALNIAQFGGGGHNAPVLIFSLEMPREQLLARMLSAEAGVDLSRLTRGLIDSAEFERVREAASRVAERNIFINDVSYLSAIDFRTQCRRFKAKYPDVGLIVVDYLQLMHSGESAARTVNRVQEVTDISRMLKATARELDCPVIALSQLSRETERRPDKKPQMSDLRDSGSIEQDADVVMMLFREDYYTENENNDLKDSQADLRIAKNRNGSTGVIHLTFKREITRFYNYGEI